MPVYDDQKQRGKNSDLHEITGIDPAEAAEMERAANRGAADDIAEREGLYNPNRDNDASEGGSGKDKKTDSAKDLKDKESGGGSARLAGGVSGAAEGLATGGVTGALKGFAKGLVAPKNRKKSAAGGGIAIGVVSVVIGLFSVGSGPFQFIHSAQLLQGFHMADNEDFNDGLSAKFLIYALAGRQAQGRLGFIANNRVDKMEARLNEDAGLKSVYSTRFQRLIGYQILDAGKAGNFLDRMAQDGITRTPTLSGVGIDGQPINVAQGEFVGFREDSHRTARSVTYTANRSIGINRVSSFLMMRMQSKRGGVDFHPMITALRKGLDNRAYRAELKEERAERLRNGASGQPSPLAERRKEAVGKLQTAAKTARGPAIIIAVACVTSGMSDSIDIQNLESQKQAIRMGMERVAMGSQVMWGDDFTAEQLAVYGEDFWDPESKTSWADDPGIRHELGEQPTSRDLISDLNLGAPKPGFFTAADEVIRVVEVIEPICGIINDVSQWPFIKQALDAVGAITDSVFLAVGAQTPDQYMQDAIDYFANGGVDVLAQGAERGGIDNVGTRMSVNNQFLAQGGRELSEAEENEVKTAVREENARVFAQASMYDRYFNMYDSRSVVAKLYMKAPKNSTQFIASIHSIPATVSNLTFQLAGGSKVIAQADLPEYKYEFPLISYSLAERNNPDYQDPFANEAYVLEGDRLERMNLEYGTVCFGISVTRTGDLEYGESGDFNLIPDKCKDEGNVELTRYRFYLAQLENGLALDCYEGEGDAESEKSCRQLGMGDQVGTAPPTGTAGNAIVGDPYTDSTSVACDPRTVDTGTIADGYTDGRMFKVRLCSIPNIPSSGQADSPGSRFSTPGGQGSVIVNSRVSGAWFTLAADAATAGVLLRAGSSFRSMEHQQSLFTGDTSLVARPGYSSHQAGVAIDFSGMSAKGGGSCATRATHSSAGYQWLRANAEKYGFKQYSVEAWHWDALPVANRCGT